MEPSCHSGSIMTYNVNYSRRAMNEYEQYSWENRRSDVYKLIHGANSDLVFLQEVLTQNREEVQVSLSDYQWHFEPTNSRDGICCNGIGVKNTFFEGVQQQKFVFNFNRFTQTAEKVLGLIIVDLCLLNVHCPMDDKGRMVMAQYFNVCIPSNKNYRVIIAGDFNSFPDCDGALQLEVIESVTKTIRISDFAISESSGEIATRSFKAYPYDIVPEAVLQMPGKLDHIFVKGLKVAENTKPIVLDARFVEDKGFSPSDHYPILVSLVLE